MLTSEPYHYIAVVTINSLIYPGKYFKQFPVSTSGSEVQNGHLQSEENMSKTL